MNIFTVNQVNQVYVAKDYKDAKLSKNSAVLGDLHVGKTQEGDLYFQHYGHGGIVRSDLIPSQNIMYAKVTPAKEMRKPIKKYKVVLKSELIDNGHLTTTEDYILRLKFDHVLSISPASQYWKYGVVRGIKNTTTPSAFYKTLALSLAKNMSREALQMVKISLTYNTTDSIVVESNTKESTLIHTYTGIVIEAVEPDWILGIKQQRPVSFKVEPTSINFNEVDFVWGEVTDLTDYAKTNTTTCLGNGKDMADYEYFFMGERGDQYRKVNWPNYVPTDYLVDPNKEYDTITIHFFYNGSNHAVQKSEKDITLIIPSDAIFSDDDNTTNDDVELSSTNPKTTTKTGKSVTHVIASKINFLLGKEILEVPAN